MIVDEFPHYFRICLNRKLSSEEAREVLFAVNDIADVEADDEDTVMVYHGDSDKAQEIYPGDIEEVHCYDVRLARDITGNQGDDILAKLEEIFPDEDFNCESSMELAEQQQYLNQALLENLKTSL